MPLLTADQIQEVAFDALAACGASDVNATSVARAVRRAEEDGLSSVGLGFLPIFLAHLLSGRVNGKAVPSVTHATPGIVRVDGGNGFAHPAMEAGYAMLKEAAHTQGAAILSVTNSYSAGVLGHAVEDLAGDGLVVLAFTNGPANIAPWGGSRALFGTNPMAFGVPRACREPMVLDQSSSTVARVTLDTALAAGGPLPQGWAIGPDGVPTTDPEVARLGTMAPAGGARGSGIALMVELLAAAMTGASLSMDMLGYGSERGPPMNIGQFFIAIDPLGSTDDFARDAEKLFAAIVNEPGARLPGDRRAENRRRSRQSGIEVEGALFDKIRAFGNRT